MATPTSKIRNRRPWATTLGAFVLLALAALGLAGTAAADEAPGTTTAPAAPAISSDKADYAPGELVTLRGSNWQPGEVVHINVNDTLGKTWVRDVDVTADAGGAISDSFNLPNYFISDYDVTATGASGTAKASFTDGNVTSVSGKVTDSAASSAISGATVRCTTESGCNATFTTTTNAAGDYVFDGGNKLTFAGNGPTTLTLTVSKAGYADGTITLPGVSNGDVFGGKNVALVPSTQNQTISFTSTAPATAKYGDTYTPTATGGGSGNAVTFGASGACGYANGTVTMTGVGTCTVTANQAGSAGYNAAPQVSQTFSVAARPVTVSFTASSKEYDGNADAVIASALVAGKVDGDVLTATGYAATYADRNVGTGKTITISGIALAGAAAANYVLANASATTTADITPKAVTVTPTAGLGKVFGASDPTLTYSAAPDLLSGDSFSGALARAAGEDVGSYAITVGTLSAGSNYDLTLSPQTFTITAKPVAVTPAAGQSKVYGSADPALAFGNDGGLGASAFTGALARAAGEDVGAYAIQLGTLSAGPNYTLSLSGTATFAITPRTVVVTPSSGQSKVYGSSDPILAFGNDGGLAAGAFTGSLGRASGENVGSYAITIGSLAAGSNFSLTLAAQAVSFSVTAKPITVTADDKSKVYGSVDPALTYTVPDGALEPGDSISGSLLRAEGKNVGTYAITKGTLTAGGNYQLTVTPGSLVITPKPITVAAVDRSKVYGSADPALTVSVPAGALEVGDSLSGSLVRAAGENVGDYAITEGSLSAGTNYTLTVTPGTLTITPKAITVTAVDKTKGYGSPDPALTYTVPAGALEQGDLLTGDLVREAGESVAGSPYAISRGDLTAGPNYQLTVTPAKLTITRKQISGSFTAADKVYDGTTEATVTGRSLAGVVGDDDVALGGGSASFDTKHVGTGKTVTLAGATLQGAAAGNYTLGAVDAAKAAITAKPITVAAVDKSKVYGTADPALTYIVPPGALESGDSLSGSLERAAGNGVGTYAITKGTLSAGSDYDLTVTPATLTITPKAITAAAVNKSKVYGSADPALTYTVPAGALEGSDVLSGSLVRAAGEDVGSYAITNGTLTAGANYELTVTPGTLTITPKPITVTADAQSKLLGAADPALGYKVTSGGLESGDTLTGGLTRVAGEAVGSYDILKGTLTAGGNYALTYVGAKLTIVYAWNGFLQPINDTAHQIGTFESRFKLGQTIPAKFRLANTTGGAVQAASDPTFSVKKVGATCDTTTDLETTLPADAVTSGTAFRWDSSLQGYIYNFSTKSLVAGEYRIYASLNDGSVKTVDVCLTK